MIAKNVVKSYILDVTWLYQSWNYSNYGYRHKICIQRTTQGNIPGITVCKFYTLFRRYKQWIVDRERDMIGSLFLSHCRRWITLMIDILSPPPRFFWVHDPYQDSHGHECAYEFSYLKTYKVRKEAYWGT